ncbi:hypothetical protein [Campylobacter ureolyticus]|uniref:hypothetical protein n=1 Tax=Campylobacter ureolyticus TaxID=827 RepID=UPI00215A41D2|nr:hypothetical protein [Campylobacter ureolyticus]MCR8699143.1 hypothetical protein [Campylobacter ureolyticus]
MSIYLIDIENVNLELFLKSKNFEKTDKFYLVGNSNLKFSMSVLEFFEDIEYKIYHFNSADKNYADKILFTILGSILNRPEYVNDKIYMVSNDNIFEELEYTENLFKKKVINLKFLNSTRKVLVKTNNNENLEIKNIYEKNKFDIKNLSNSYKNNGDFHNALVKKYGMQIGKNIYKFMKDN